jgi:hypothetical protein
LFSPRDWRITVTLVRNINIIQHPCIAL